MQLPTSVTRFNRKQDFALTAICIAECSFYISGKPKRQVSQSETYALSLDDEYEDIVHTDRNDFIL